MATYLYMFNTDKHIYLQAVYIYSYILKMHSSWSYTSTVSPIRLSEALWSHIGQREAQTVLVCIVNSEEELMWKMWKVLLVAIALVALLPSCHSQGGNDNYT